jgi:hypothetical protein
VLPSPHPANMQLKANSQARQMSNINIRRIAPSNIRGLLTLVLNYIIGMRMVLMNPNTLAN